MSIEVNFDGLVGPTHNYAGLSFGNLASKAHQGAVSNPRAAALQGLAKMRALMDLGLTQGVLPPHERPHMAYLRQLGFIGNDEAVVREAFAYNPALLATVSSSSFMWTANAATFSPSHDCADGRAHFSVANLVSMPHRSLEAEFSRVILRRLFQNERYFRVHEALPPWAHMGDEGAANHNRLCAAHGQEGLELFVYGRKALSANEVETRFPARQTLEASQAIARRHGLKHTDFIAQSPIAIDGGAFHNDVVCVANETVLLFHEQAFENVAGLKEGLRRHCAPLGFEPHFIMAEKDQMPLSEAITSYLFNSQLVSLGEGRMALIVPSEAQEITCVAEFAQAMVADDNPLTQVIYKDVRESMSNGGGPACLRLRVVLTPEELNHMHQGVLLNEAKLAALEAVVKRHYRDRLSPQDLGDPQLLSETRSALNAISEVLDLGSIYPFQRA